MSASNNIAKVAVTGLLIIGIGAVLVGHVENVMTDMQTSDMSEDFNDTIDDLISYVWISYGLIALGTILLGARYILQQVGYL